MAAAGWSVLEVGFWVWGNGRPVSATRLKRCYDLVYFMSKETRDLKLDDARGAFKAGEISGRDQSEVIASSEDTMGRMFHKTGVRTYAFGNYYYPANVACQIGCEAFSGSGYDKVFSVKRVMRIGKTEKKHPVEKPVDLMGQIVKIVSEPGDLVLDPWMGSGTTGVACVALSRRFIGVDAVKSYVEMARERIRKTQIQLPGLGM